MQQVSSLCSLSSVTCNWVYYCAFVTTQVDLTLKKIHLDPLPKPLLSGKQVKVVIKKKPKSFQFDPLVFADVFWDQQKKMSDLYVSVSCSYHKSMGWLKTSSPDPDDEDELCWVKKSCPCFVHSKRRQSRCKMVKFFTRRRRMPLAHYSSQDLPTVIYATLSPPGLCHHSG